MTPSFPTLEQPTPADAIDAFAAELARRAAELPVHTLLPGDELRLSGHLFAGAVPLVLAVGEALQAWPALFPSSPVTGQALLAAQERATAWLLLRDQLQVLAQRAQQAYLLEQGEAVRAAYWVLQQVDHEDALPPRPGGPDRLLRDVVLAAARRAQATRPRRPPSKRSRTPAGREAARVELRRLLQGRPPPGGGGEPGPAQGTPAAPADPTPLACLEAVALAADPVRSAGPAPGWPGSRPGPGAEVSPADPPASSPQRTDLGAPCHSGLPLGLPLRDKPPPRRPASTRAAGGGCVPGPWPGRTPIGLGPPGASGSGSGDEAVLWRAPGPEAPDPGVRPEPAVGLPGAPAVPRSCRCAPSPTLWPP